MDDETLWITVALGWGIFMLLILWTKWRDGAFKHKETPHGPLMNTEEQVLDKWTLVEERSFTEEEKNQLSFLEVIKASDGSLSVILHIKNGASTFIPLDKNNQLSIGSRLDIDKVYLRKWKRLNHERYDISIVKISNML